MGAALNICYILWDTAAAAADRQTHGRTDIQQSLSNRARYVPIYYMVVHRKVKP